MRINFNFVTIGKFLKTTVAFILVILIFLWVGIIFLAKFKGQSYVGKIVKSYVIRYPAIIKLVNLNEPGDARFVYLHESYPSINVKLFTIGDIQPNRKVEEVGWCEEALT